MKKIIAALVGAGVLAAWPAATWFYGSRAQASAEHFSSAITQAIPYLGIESSEYKKGFMKASQTIRLRPNFPAAANKAWPDIVIENAIEHGPFPGFSSVGAARIKHTLVLPPETKAELAKLWGQQEPLNMVTQMNLAGGGTTTFSSSAATAKFDKTNVAFQGLNGVMNFTAGFGTIDYTLNAPGALVEDAEGKLLLGKVSSSGMQTKLAGTERIYTGKQTANFDSLEFFAKGQSAANIKNITYAVETTAPQPNLLSGKGKLTGQSVKFGAYDLGAIDYTYSLSDLHAPSLEAITKAMQTEFGKMSAKAGDPTKNATPPNDVLLKALTQHLPELSKHVPKINIEKMRVGTANDYAQLNGSLVLKPMTAQEAASPMTMLPKLDAAINIELSESILALLAKESTNRMMGGGEEMAARMTPEQKLQVQAQAESMVNEQLNALVQQGYIVRGVGKVSAQIALKEGNLTVNGKPVGGNLMPKK